MAGQGAPYSEEMESLKGETPWGAWVKVTE